MVHFLLQRLSIFLFNKVDVNNKSSKQRQLKYPRKRLDPLKINYYKFQNFKIVSKKIFVSYLPVEQLTSESFDYRRYYTRRRIYSEAICMYAYTMV